MKRLVVSGALCVLLLSLAVSIAFADSRGRLVSINARFINWPVEEDVIHVLGTLDYPSPVFEGGWVATLGRGSPILFGFEMSDPDMEYLQDFKDDTSNNIRLKIDGAVVADNLRLFWQDPFVAQPLVGPDWTWDHDGDGLGDGNGNGVDDWNGPVMFWRFEIKPKLDFGDHIWQLEMTYDDWLTVGFITNGILSIVE